MMIVSERWWNKRLQPSSLTETWMFSIHKGINTRTLVSKGGIIALKWSTEMGKDTLMRVRRIV